MILFMSGFYDYVHPYPTVYSISAASPGYIAHISDGIGPPHEASSIVYDGLRDR